MVGLTELTFEERERDVSVRGAHFRDRPLQSRVRECGSVEAP
jgi:hypothetical protein